MLSIATAERKEVIILGDVNVNYLCKNDNKEFKDIMALYGFQQMVNQATRICESTETLIDIISTNNPESMKCTKVVPCSFSDHDLICCVRKLNHTFSHPEKYFVETTGNTTQKQCKKSFVDLIGQAFTMR